MDSTEADRANADDVMVDVNDGAGTSADLVAVDSATLFVCVFPPLCAGACADMVGELWPKSVGSTCTAAAGARGDSTTDADGDFSIAAGDAPSIAVDNGTAFCSAEKCIDVLAGISASMSVGG